MPLLAILDQAAFDALPDQTVLGKDSYLKNEKENNFNLALSGEEAGKLATPLQNEVTKLKENNAKLLDEKIKVTAKATAFEKLGKTPEEIDAILKAGKTETIEELEKKYQTQFDSLKTSTEQQVKAAQDAIVAKDTETQEIRTQLRQTIKKQIVADLKNKYGINDLGDDYLANRIDVIPEADGSNKFVPRVLMNGEIAYKAGTFMTPEQLAEEAKANKALGGMFDAGKGGGSGGDPHQKRPASGNGFVNSGDKDAIGANLEDIAAGKVKVV